MKEQRNSFALRGSVCYSIDKDTLATWEDAYVICEDGVSGGVFERLPDRYQGIRILDHRDKLIVPGMIDLHIHAPQYAFRGLGMDMELLDWLNERAFAEEAKYADPGYAGEAYGIFAEEMKKSETARACIFATIHREATEILMDELEKTGLFTLVGKVNMDRNSPESLTEVSPAQASSDTETWIARALGRYRNVAPILTPRFIPSCSDELMEELRKLKVRYGLPLQSHLSENEGEISWVASLCPDARFYGDAYDRMGLLEGEGRTVMAHCVYSGPEELKLLKERGVYVAHCPQSNTNLSSGIAPVRSFLEGGVDVGLGTDVAGGASISMFRAMADAVQVSKLRRKLLDDGLRPLTAAEAFYLATKGGGSFFGQVGSLEQGYEFDALVLDDAMYPHPQKLEVKERMERLLYLYDGRCLAAKYVSGREINV